jgi:hypothetical protein
MSAEDLKTSILVKKQVPEFIRDEYPKFVTFLESYYEFLEAQADTPATSNNLIHQQKQYETFVMLMIQLSNLKRTSIIHTQL